MDSPKDDLKWFGEGFNGFPKRLPDDVVEYIIFIIDSTLSDIQTRARLQAFQRAFNALEKKFLKEYIWQRDAMNLELARQDHQWLLRGRMNYGDSVADEWLVVYFLRELSQEFNDAWIRVYDSDGEFLLIEAANALPKWLSPEVSENRVWINNRRLFVIPLGKDEEPGPLTQVVAYQILRDTPARPQNYSKVESEAFHRLNGYPAAISDNQHHATIPLPRKVAHILHLNPAYIAPIVEAFYLRDPISVRLLQPETSDMPLIFSPEDFVEVSVRFTRVLYAQLLGQSWSPPRAWNSALDTLLRSGKSAEKSEIGVKVTAGAQMLIAHKLFNDKKAVRELKLRLDDLQSGNDILPTDMEIATWPKRDDDEGWLDIDFTEFERELEGKGSYQPKGFGDKIVQQNVKKMVERFNAFLADDEAGVEGADWEADPMDEDNDSDIGREWEDPEYDDSDQSETTQKISHLENKAQAEAEAESLADEEYAGYEEAYEKFMKLSVAEKAILTDEARALALAQDAEDAEDEEIQMLSRMMEAELSGHGVLGTDSRKSVKSGNASSNNKRPKKRHSSTGKVRLEEAPEENEENDDNDDLLDENFNLADNMLKAFKEQAGMAGPAGNMMKLMGIQFPQDADDELNDRSTKVHHEM